MTLDKKRGRPPIAEEARRSKNFTFRGRGDLHERLATAAAKSGRSISEEIEWRLEGSFQKETVSADLNRIEATLIAEKKRMIAEQEQMEGKLLELQKRYQEMAPLTDLLRLIATGQTKLLVVDGIEAGDASPTGIRRITDGLHAEDDAGRPLSEKEWRLQAEKRVAEMMLENIKKQLTELDQARESQADPSSGRAQRNT